MAYALTGSGNAGSAGASSLGISATVAAGETVIVIVGMQSPSSPTLTVSDGTNTYAAATAFTTDGSTIAGAQIFKADSVSAGTFTITASRTAGSGNITGIAFFRYTGLASGAVQTSEATAFTGSGGGTFTGASLTPTSQPAIFFSATAGQNGTPASAGSGFTDRGALSNITTSPMDAEDERLTATSAVTANWATFAHFDGYAIVSFILSEAASDTLMGQACL